MIDAGTGNRDKGLSHLFTLHNEGRSDDEKTQILIIEDNTYSAYALMSILEQYQIQS